MGTTVVIVDDQPAFRRVVRALLEAEGFDVVGEAVDGRTAVAVVEELQPDVVLLDVRLPDRSGPEVARLLRDRAASAVVLTSTADYAYAVAGCGAAGFLPKAELSAGALLALIEPR